MSVTSRYLCNRDSTKTDVIRACIVVSEFNETPDAAFEVDGEETIQEDRPRAIRFA